MPDSVSWPTSSEICPPFRCFRPGQVKSETSPQSGKKQGVVFLDMYSRRLNTSGTNPTNLFDVFQDMIMFDGYACIGDGAAGARVYVRSTYFVPHSFPQTKSTHRAFCWWSVCWCRSSNAFPPCGLRTSSTSTSYTCTSSSNLIPCLPTGSSPYTIIELFGKYS